MTDTRNHHTAKNKDYRVDVKVKNNKLMRKILDAGFKTPSAFSRETGFSAATLGQALNLKLTLYDSRMHLRSFPSRLAEFFLCEPTDLFPEEVWYVALKENSMSVEATSGEIKALYKKPMSIPMLENKIDMENLVAGMMGALEGRHKRVIEMRFMEGLTYEECGKIFGVTRERVRQIEAKALRLLRAPKRSGDAMEFVHEGGLD